MKIELFKYFLLFPLVVGLLFLSPKRSTAQKLIGSTQVKAEIDVTQTKPKIDSLLYGHFIENVGTYFEGGLWAEMLGDRKFFYPVNNEIKQTPSNSRAGVLGQWKPVGGDGVITMDTDHPYVGEQSPRITVVANTAHGIKQDSLSLVKGKKYEGRVVLAATTSRAGNPGSSIKVSMVWGDGSGDRQSITIDTLSSQYETYHFSFTSGADTKEGRFKITGTGTGSFLVGVTSLMPADNIDGFRPNLLKQLREMNVTMLRWGGNQSSAYEWRDGIGDPDKRPPRYDYVWGAVDQNNVGTLEVLKLCELIGAVPNIGVNSGFGDAYSAAQWVEYVNGSKDTPMGKLRAKQGHPEPFYVKWWGIGNEMYGNWQFGHMALDQYVIKHNMFAKRMRKVDPDITLVAIGATSYEQHKAGGGKYKRPIKYFSKLDFTGGLLKHSSDYFDYISEHVYPSPTMYYNKEKQEHIKIDNPLPINVIRRAANHVEGSAEEWEEYKRRMPWLRSSNKKMVLDEWIASHGHGLKNALGVATVLNEMFRHTGVFEMATYTPTTSALTYNNKEAKLRADGLVFKLYSSQFEDIPVQVNGDSPQKELRGTFRVDKPKKTSGSATYPLDVMASISRDHQTLTVTVVNATRSEQKLTLAIKGANVINQAQKWTITGPSFDAENDIEKGIQVTLEKRADENLKPTIQVDPISINLYKISIKK